MPVFVVLLVAAGLVGVAWAQDEPAFAYGGGGAAVLLLIAMLVAEQYERRTAEDEPVSLPAESETSGNIEPSADGVRLSLQSEAARVPTQSATGDDDVYVIPGRRRYHRDDCHLLTGHDSETLAIEDAVDEGFTPCSVCFESQSQKRA